MYEFNQKYFNKINFWHFTDEKELISLYYPCKTSLPLFAILFEHGLRILNHNVWIEYIDFGLRVAVPASVDIGKHCAQHKHDQVGRVNYDNVPGEGLSEHALREFEPDGVSDHEGVNTQPQEGSHSLAIRVVHEDVELFCRANSYKAPNGDPGLA